MSNDIHKVRVMVDSRGYAEVTLDDKPISNLTRLTVDVIRGRAEVALTLENVEVEMVGVLPRRRVTERVETYESDD